MWCYLKYLINLLLLLSAFSSFGQVLITPTQLPQGEIALDKPFFLQLNNNQPQAISGQLKVVLSQDKEILAEITYQQIQLPQGISTINTNELTKVNESISSTSLQQSRKLVDGDVELCFSFTSVLDNTELGQHCSNISLSQQKIKTNTLPLPIRFTGYAEVSGNYSNRQGSFQNLPANYTNVIINPQLEVFGIPIGARLNYSTASDKNFQNMNLFNIYFDAEKFRQNMDKKYLKNMGADYLLEKTELNDYNKKVDDLDRLNKILSNPFIKNELSRLDKLDSLNKLLQDSSVYMESERLSYLQKQRDSLSPLEEKRDAYQSLLQKQKALSRVVNIYEKPLDVNTLKDSLAVLEEKLNISRNPFPEQDNVRLNNIDSLLSNTELTKSRREVLKQQRDRLYENKKKAKEYELLKEDYVNLRHTYDYTSKLDSIRKQRGDAGSIYNNKDSIKDALRNPSKLKDKFGFLKSFKSINFGFFAPYTGELTLNGVPIRGGGVEMQFKKFFWGTAYGKAQRISGLIEENNSPTPFERKLMSAWVGVGQQGKNFITLQIIDAKDLGEHIAITSDTNQLFYSNTGNNKVLSTQFQTSFFKGKTILKGEAAGSHILENKPSSELLSESPTNQTTGNWISQIINQTSTPKSKVGYGFNVSLNQLVNKNRTEIKLSSKKTSPTYVSFGNPFMLTDIFMNEAKVTQKLWQGRISLSGFYRLLTDNLNNIKSFTTRNENFGGDLSVRVPNWPTLRVLYMPMVQQTPGNYFNTNLFTATSTYGLRKGGFYHQWSVMYTQQKANSRIGYNNFASTNYTATYFLSYKQKFNTSLSLNKIEQQSTTPVGGYIGTITIGYLYKRKLNQQIGLTLADNNLGNRKSYFYDLSYQIFKNITLKIRYQNTNYLSSILIINDNSYNENLLTFSLIKNW